MDFSSQEKDKWQCNIKKQDMDAHGNVLQVQSHMQVKVGTTVVITGHSNSMSKGKYNLHFQGKTLTVYFQHRLYRWPMQDSFWKQSAHQHKRRIEWSRDSNPGFSPGKLYSCCLFMYMYELVCFSAISFKFLVIGFIPMHWSSWPPPPPPPPHLKCYDKIKQDTVTQISNSVFV